MIKKPTRKKKTSTKSKTAKPTRRRMTTSKEQNFRGGWQSALHPEAHHFYPGVSQLRERLIFTLHEWAQDPENIEIGQFTIKYQIPFQTMYEWIDTYPDVKQAWKQAKMMLASHRRVGSMKRKLDPKSCYRDMYKYDPSENEVDERASRLRTASDDNQQGNVIIKVVDVRPEVITKEDMKEEQDAQ